MIEVKIGANLFKYSQNWDPRPLAYHVLSWFSSSWFAGIFVLLNWRVFLFHRLMQMFWKAIWMVWRKKTNGQPQNPSQRQRNNGIELTASSEKGSHFRVFIFHCRTFPYYFFYPMKWMNFIHHGIIGTRKKNIKKIKQDL